MRGDVSLVTIPGADIELFSSVTVPTIIRLLLNWGTNQPDTLPCKCMGKKKARVCECDSYSATHHHSETLCFLWGPLQTQPRGSLTLLWSCLPICSYFPTHLWFCLLQDPEGMKETRQTAHVILMCIDFYPSNFPHGSGIQTHAGDHAREQEANHIHMNASHGNTKKAEGKPIIPHRKAHMHPWRG